MIGKVIGRKTQDTSLKITIGENLLLPTTNYKLRTSLKILVSGRFLLSLNHTILNGKFAVGHICQFLVVRNNDKCLVEFIAQ